MKRPNRETVKTTTNPVTVSDTAILTFGEPLSCSVAYDACALSNLCIARERFNEWLWFPDYHVLAYVRKTSRFIYGVGMRNTLDLANIEVEEQERGLGNFRKFMLEFESVASKHGLTVYVESVLNPILSACLLRRGYTELHGYCYHKLNIGDSNA